MNNRPPTVLIVEDSESKRASIETVLEREFPGVIIKRALSVKSAIDSLQVTIPEMVIADMSLPTFDIETRERGGTPRPFGGIEVFETLERNEIIVPVLVVTSYPEISDGKQSMGLLELSERLKSEFPDMFVGVVYFDSAYSKWEHEIMSYFSSVLKDRYGT